jgi:hypothetical protein
MYRYDGGMEPEWDLKDKPNIGESLNTLFAQNTLD